MWTYLTIFLSIFLIFAVFARRLILFTVERKRNKNKKSVNEDDELSLTKDSIKLSKTDKETVESLNKRGMTMITAGKDDEAIKCFVQALSINPGHTETMKQLAILYLKKDMFSPASALFKELSILEEDPIILSHLGFAYYKMNDFLNALDAYQNAVTLDPSRPQRFISLCQVYRELENHELALVSLNKALDLDPENVEYRYLLSEIYQDLEKLDSAQKTLELIVEKDGENKEAKSMLRILKKKIRDNEK